MQKVTPILLNHDHTLPIGVVRDGVGEFAADQRVTREQLFAIFGGAGIRLLEQFEEKGTVYIRKFEILEFSLCPEAAAASAPTPSDRLKPGDRVTVTGLPYPHINGDYVLQDDGTTLVRTGKA